MKTREPLPTGNGQARRRRNGVVIGVLAVVFLLLLSRALSSVEVGRIPYSKFKREVAAGKVAEVEISPSVIRGRRKPDGDGRERNGSVFTTVRVEDKDLLPALEAARVRVDGALESHGWAGALGWLLPVGIFLLFWLPTLSRMGRAGGGLLPVGQSKAKVYMEKDVDVRFADVAGVDEAKQELQEVLHFLKEPARFGRLGARIPKGILLVGPPGTGKTLLARAVAGEAGVPFFSISGSDFVEMFVGVGAARVRDLFEQAKTKAPCIIFIDELDAIGKVRGVGPIAHEEREQTLNQVLVEMDGFDPRVGVILMAATNRPEILDPALLRAGRFDRHVLVDRPDKQGRLDILRVHARQIVLDDAADLEALASMTAGFVGADLANIINEAALLGVRHDRDKVGRAELEEAVERVVAGLEKKNRVLTPAEKRRVAHHEIGHALVALALPGTDLLQKISIIPRGIAALGYTLQVPTEDRFLMARSELENKIAVLLGGRAAEIVALGEVSTGAQDDLAKATAIARRMVKAYGMSDGLGAQSFEADRRPLFLPGPEAGRGDLSEDTTRAIDAEVAAILARQERRAAEILAARTGLLGEAAALLVARETITGDELRALTAAAGARLSPVALAAGAGPPAAPLAAPVPAIAAAGSPTGSALPAAGSRPPASRAGVAA